MLVAAAPRDGDGDDRPRPKRPEVLITTAATGDGRPGAARRARPPPGRSVADVGMRVVEPARLARAEAQVWAIVADRLRDAAARRRATGRATDALLG